ncbi:MAG: hypothetical protein ACXWNE_12880, partial [Candidatus Binataceae bacterium]
IILYYLHERVWSNVMLGRKGPAAEARAGIPVADGQVETDLGAALAAAAGCPSLDSVGHPRPTASPACTLSTIHLSKGAST